jgi:hypothetical protein
LTVGGRQSAVVGRQSSVVGRRARVLIPTGDWTTDDPSRPGRSHKPGALR